MILPFEGSDAAEASNPNVYFNYVKARFFFKVSLTLFNRFL